MVDDPTVDWSWLELVTLEEILSRKENDESRKTLTAHKARGQE